MPYDLRPWVGDIEASTRKFCCCGESATKPFCDGSHHAAGNGKTPIKATLETSKRYSICMCGHTGNSPFCDGTHKTLPR